MKGVLNSVANTPKLVPFNPFPTFRLDAPEHVKSSHFCHLRESRAVTVCLRQNRVGRSSLSLSLLMHLGLMERA
jgi:adenine C2-methylase RlmN of 23S rRNA A2503 and tRNA A37